jgi:hypothetical protein
MRLSESERAAFIARLAPDEALALLYDWQVWARDAQLPPPGQWRFWWIKAGRGFGKTRSGAEWVHEQARKYEWISLVGPTLDDVRETMIEGESGLLATAAPWWRPRWIANRRLLEWPNGARASYFTADEPDRLRGKQHQAGWLEEPASWRYPDALDQYRFGFRLPPDPRTIVTGTPRPVRTCRELLSDPDCVVTGGSTYENLANLDSSYKRIVARYEGTNLGRQELLAELIEHDEEALIPRTWMSERCRGPAAPHGEPRPAVLGVDVASTGVDDSCIALKAGPYVSVLRRWHEPDTMRLVDVVESVAYEHGCTAINVDVIGVGQGVFDELRRRFAGRGVRVVGVNVGAASDEPDRFKNLRAQLWWAGRELSEAGAWNLDALDDDTLDELATPHWGHGAGGRVQIEPNDEIKQRLGRSPDAATAVLLSALTRATKRVAAW